jgi:hypothetical protein
MTNKEAIKMLTAKVECMQREISGTDIDCTLRNCDNCELCYAQGTIGEQIKALNIAISALQTQPTLCGYDIKRLMTIAEVLRKENLPPERIAEALTDIGRIVSIVRDEFEESLRKAVEQCKI